MMKGFNHGPVGSVSSSTTRELRIERLKQVREQSKRLEFSKTACYNKMRDARREQKYAAKREVKVNEKRKALRELSSNWQASLLATGGAHRASYNAAVATERNLENQETIKGQNRIEAVARNNSASVVFREEEMRGRLSEFQAMHVKEIREDASAHDREDARANGDSYKAAIRVAADRKAWRERNDPSQFTTVQRPAFQRAISVLDRGTVFVDARVLRHNDVGATQFAVQNSKVSFENDGVRKFHGRVMEELLGNVSSKEREKEAKKKASRKMHAHTIDDDLQALLTMDRAQMRMSRIKSVEQIPSADESPKIVRKFEKVFMKETEDAGDGYERNQEPVSEAANVSSEPVVQKRKGGTKAWKGDLLDAAANVPPAAARAAASVPAPTVLAPPPSLAFAQKWADPSVSQSKTFVEGQANIPLAWDVQDTDATFGSTDVPTGLVDFGDSLLDDTMGDEDAPVPVRDVIAVMRSKVNNADAQDDLDFDFGATMRAADITAQLASNKGKATSSAPTLELSVSPDRSWNGDDDDDDDDDDTDIPHASFQGGIGYSYDAYDDNNNDDLATTNSSASTNIARHDSIVAGGMDGISGVVAGAAAGDQYADFFRESFDEVDEDGIMMRRSSTSAGAPDAEQARAGAGRGVAQSQDSWDEMFAGGREGGGAPPTTDDFGIDRDGDDLDSFMDELGVGESSSGSGTGVKVKVSVPAVLGQRSMEFDELFMESPDDDDDDDDEPDLTPPPGSEDDDDDDDDIAGGDTMRQTMVSRGGTVRSSVRSSYGESDLVEGELDELSASWLEKQSHNNNANASMTASEPESDGPSVPPSPALWDMPSPGPSPARRPSDKSKARAEPSPRVLQARYVEPMGVSAGAGAGTPPVGVGSSSSSVGEDPSSSSGAGLEESTDSLGGSGGTGVGLDFGASGGERSRAAIMAELGAARARLQDMAGEQQGGSGMDDSNSSKEEA